MELLQNGQEMASGASESRHRILTSALDNMRVSVSGGRERRG